MLYPKSLTEIIMKHDLILSVIFCQKVTLLFENHLQLSQKYSETKLQFSGFSYTHTHSTLSKNKQGDKHIWKAKAKPLKKTHP